MPPPTNTARLEGSPAVNPWPRGAKISTVCPSFKLGKKLSALSPHLKDQPQSSFFRVGVTNRNRPPESLPRHQKMGKLPRLRLGGELPALHSKIVNSGLELFFADQPAGLGIVFMLCVILPSSPGEDKTL